MIVETKGLSKQYKRLHALDNVDVQIRQGEIFGLIGDNGAGKTTLLKALAGQIYPSSGELALFGETQEKELQQVRRRMGALIENANYFPELTVERNLEFLRRQKGVPGREVVDEVLSMAGLLQAKKKKGKELSLGMKQRLGIAIALLGGPELLILDEPINGLDPSGIIEIRNMLLKLNQEKNVTILISSHILSELEQLATTYCFLQNGKVLECISAKDLAMKCEDYIEIVVDDPKKYATLLEQQLQHSEYRVMPDGSIQILQPDEDVTIYSRLAMTAGMAVAKFDRYKHSLEEYYVNLKQGGRK